jgi:hypothetical protein
MVIFLVRLRRWRTNRLTKLPEERNWRDALQRQAWQEKLTSWQSQMAACQRRGFARVGPRVSVVVSPVAARNQESVYDYFRVTLENLAKPN